MKDVSWVDYSHEVKVSRHPAIRFLLQALAIVFLVLGIVSIFLPVLPTTPFLLLASACYARSSIRFYNAMMNHRRLGPPLRTWKEKRAISRKNKVLAVGLLTVTTLPTVLFVIPVLLVKGLVAAICLSVATFILTRPEA